MIKLHSEYQNDSGAPKTDVMGIMAAWFVPTSPGYPRPKGATPTQGVAGARLQRVHRPNRVHGPPDFPGNALEPRRVLQPAGAELEPADGRHARRERRPGERRRAP